MSLAGLLAPVTVALLFFRSEASMKQISNSTFMLKRVTPCFVVGWTLLVECLAIGSKLKEGAPSSHIVFGVSVGLAIIAIFSVTYVKLIMPIADAVFDDDDTLVIKRRSITTVIPLDEVINVNYSQFSNPSLVTLRFRRPTALGIEISFIPTSRYWPFSRHPVVEDLIQRIDAAKRDPRAV